MRRMFLIGLTVSSLGLALAGCNKAKQADPVADEEQALNGHEGGHERRGGHQRMCEAPDAEARIAKMQKCQSETTAACNTQVYGSATPTKDVICGNKDKMREVWKCVRDKIGDDKEKHREERKKMRECMGGES